MNSNNITIGINLLDGLPAAAWAPAFLTHLSAQGFTVYALPHFVGDRPPAKRRR